MAEIEDNPNPDEGNNPEENRKYDENRTSVHTS